MSGVGLFVLVALVILHWKEQRLFTSLDALLFLALQLPEALLGLIGPDAVEALP